MALVNPGMGWVFHHYDNGINSYGGRLEPWDTVDEFPGVGVIYLRLAVVLLLRRARRQIDRSIVDIPRSAGSLRQADRVPVHVLRISGQES